MLPYEKFEAWKIAHDLALEVYRISDKWPVCERYQLTSQVRRAALSIPTTLLKVLQNSMSFGIALGR